MRSLLPILVMLAVLLVGCASSTPPQRRIEPRVTLAPMAPIVFLDAPEASGLIAGCTVAGLALATHSRPVGQPNLYGDLPRPGRRLLYPGGAVTVTELTIRETDPRDDEYVALVLRGADEAFRASTQHQFERAHLLRDLEAAPCHLQAFYLQIVSHRASAHQALDVAWNHLRSIEDRTLHDRELVVHHTLAALVARARGELDRAADHLDALLATTGELQEVERTGVALLRAEIAVERDEPDATVRLVAPLTIAVAQLIDAFIQRDLLCRIKRCLRRKRGSHAARLHLRHLTTLTLRAVGHLKDDVRE